MLGRSAKESASLGATAPLIDPFGRAIEYLRVSVTDRCDFRCVYCMSEHMTFLPKQDLLTLEGMTPEIVDKLAEANVHTRDDLADLPHLNGKDRRLVLDRHAAAHLLQRHLDMNAPPRGPAPPATADTD